MDQAEKKKRLQDVTDAVQEARFLVSESGAVPQDYEIAARYLVDTWMGQTPMPLADELAQARKQGEKSVGSLEQREYAVIRDILHRRRYHSWFPDQYRRRGRWAVIVGVTAFCVGIAAVSSPPSLNIPPFIWVGATVMASALLIWAWLMSVDLKGQRELLSTMDVQAPDLVRLKTTLKQETLCRLQGQADERQAGTSIAYGDLEVLADIHGYQLATESKQRKRRQQDDTLGQLA